MLNGLKRIPGLAPGILFFSLATAADAQIELARDLFDDRLWDACRRECRRIAAADPAQEQSRLLAAICELRLNPQAGADAIATLEELRLNATAATVRVTAAFEAGCALWAAHNAPAAYTNLKYAFENATNTDIFRRSAACLFWLLREDWRVANHDSSWRLQLDTVVNALDPATLAAGRRPRPPGANWLARPGEWIVRFYRWAIRPGIGDRCSLEPSCSEYFLQASRAHGLGGLPMIADRLVREPSVVSAAEQPIRTDTETVYADPVADHDFWLKNDKKK